jgi:hypothetical protein
MEGQGGGEAQGVVDQQKRSNFLVYPQTFGWLLSLFQSLNFPSSKLVLVQASPTKFAT